MCWRSSDNVVDRSKIEVHLPYVSHTVSDALHRNILLRCYSGASRWRWLSPVSLTLGYSTILVRTGLKCRRIAFVFTIELSKIYCCVSSGATKVVDHTDVLLAVLGFSCWILRLQWKRPKSCIWRARAYDCGFHTLET